MKTVVITGSGRGFGLEMLKVFRKNNFNCVVCDVNEEVMDEAKVSLEAIPSKGEVYIHPIDVTNYESINTLILDVSSKFKTIDIWINNAGVNQPDLYFWELDDKTISKLVDIDLKGVMYCTNAIARFMLKQGYGAIFAVEGHGSNDALIPKLTLYGTSKRAVTYFMDSMNKELQDKNIIVGKITPGIMMTNFIHNSLGDGEHIDIDPKTIKIYNILGDYPETIASNLVPKIINNKKKNPKYVWLTKGRAFGRFMSAPFKKRNIFK